jgi:hypothetical protein
MAPDSARTRQSPGGNVLCSFVVFLQPTKIGLQTVFQKELYNCVANVAVWRVLRKRLHLKAYQLSIVPGVKCLSIFRIQH